MTTYIYGLFDPTTSELRYVGKSNNPEQRYGQHIRNKDKTHKTNWIQSLLKNKEKPELYIIDAVKESEWQFWEQWYIEYFKATGCELVNGTLGGDGVLATNDVKAKISKSLTGRLLSEESKEKMRQAKLGKTQSSETIAKRIKSTGDKNKGKKRSEEQKLTISNGHMGQTAWNKGIKMPAEFGQKISALQTGRLRSDSHKKNIGLSHIGCFKKLNHDKILEIDYLLTQKRSCRSIARQFGISHKIVGQIKNKKYKYLEHIRGIQ